MYRLATSIHKLANNLLCILCIDWPPLYANTQRGFCVFADRLPLYENTQRFFCVSMYRRGSSMIDKYTNAQKPFCVFGCIEVDEHASIHRIHKRPFVYLGVIDVYTKIHKQPFVYLSASPSSLYTTIHKWPFVYLQVIDVYTTIHKQPFVYLCLAERLYTDKYTNGLLCNCVFECINV